MRQKLAAITAVFFLTITVHPVAHGQWVQTKVFDRHTWGRAGIYSLAANGTNLFAATPDSGVFLSTDNGISWAAVNDLSEAGGPKDTYALAIYGMYLFAGCDTGTIFLSTNDGKSWIQSRKGSSGSGIIDAFAVSGTNIFAGDFGGGVYRSTDSGASWTVENNGLVDPYGDTETYIPALAVNGTNLFAGTDAGGIFLSTDSGTTWAPSGLNNFEAVFALAVVGTNIFAGTGGSAGYSVYLSTDSGVSWNGVNSGITDSSPQLDISSFYAFGTNIFVATEEAGVFLSTDTGTSWVSVNDGLPSPPPFYHYVDVFSICGPYLYAGTTDTGVWRRPLSEMIPFSDVSQNSSANPENTLRVFPNPTAESITVEAASGPVTIFDPLGRCYTVPMRGSTLDVSTLAPGVYFISDGVSKTKFVKE